MANLFERDCDVCKKLNGECRDDFDCMDDRVQKPTFSVDKNGFIGWQNDLDYVCLSPEELKTIANAMGYDLVKR